MENIQQIIEVLTKVILERLGDEIDLVFQYGSSLEGITHKYSDLDISYVPVHETTRDSITVLMSDRLVDLYPIHWSKLVQMAEFRDFSASVLLHHRILFQKDEITDRRFSSLVTQLQSNLQPDARPEMVRVATQIFTGVGYPYFLLRQQSASGHLLDCLQQAQVILRTVFHTLAVCNQACIDTRRLDQVLTLPRLPIGFAKFATRLINSVDPDEILSYCTRMLETTRDMLLSEQHQVVGGGISFTEVFDSAYPELKRDIQQILISCERQDLFSLKGSLVSLYHELSKGIASVTQRKEYSDFNCLSEYEQNFVVLGFPPLLPALLSSDFDELHRRCLDFDNHLQEFLEERSVGLRKFPSINQLQEYLESEGKHS